MREVDAYKLFSHVPNIISAYDHAVATERGADESTKTVYILLPYYRRGNLQDMINANLVNHSQFPEKRLMMLFLGVCKALRSMHNYTSPPAERMQMGREDDDHAEQDDRPLMASENQVAQGGRTQSYVHRDIKPGNIMIDDSGSGPILMDLGSVAPSPIPVTSQSVALQIQDTAAEHSTMPYRAPELFDVQNGTVIDAKTDIWSLGCTLFACLVGKSPFEMRSDETGGTLSLCVQGGDWRFPDETPAGAKRVNSIQVAKAKAAAGGVSSAAGNSDDVAISEPIREVVRRCLKVEADERPDIKELIAIVEAVIEELPASSD